MTALGLGTAALAWWSWQLVLGPLLRPMPDAALALEVEERLPDSGDLLASALFFAQGSGGGGSAPLRATVVRQAELAARSLRPVELVRWRGARDRLALGLTAVLLLAVAALAHPDTAGLWLRRNVLLEDAQWPRATRLALVDFPAPVRYVPPGAQVEVRVRAFGKVPRTARLELRDVLTGTVQTLDMAREGPGRFAARTPPVNATSAFTVRAGDARLPEHRLEVVERPAVASARMVVRPPAYISPEPVELAWNAPAFEVPAGSGVSISLRATKALSAATCTVDGGAPQAMKRVGAREVSYELRADRDLTCEFSLTDTVGIGMAEPLRVSITALEDRPPTARLTASGVGDILLPTARVPVQVSVSDDYGVTGVRLLRRYEPADGSVDYPPVDLLDGPAGSQFSAGHIVELAPLGLPPEGRLVLSASAEDNRVPAPPNSATAPPLSFRLVSVQELLSALLLRQQDLRRDLEEQIARPAELSRVPELTASGYAALLEQMLNNGIISRAAFQHHSAEIVEPLRAAAEALAGGRLEQARADMQRARAAMMLLESYGGVVASLAEVADTERTIRDETGQLESDILDLLEQ